MRERKKKIKLSVCILQLRLKEIAGRALLHTDADTQNAALVIPVKVPPRIYRLDLRRDRGGYSLGGSRGRVRNYYSVKEGLDWLRTTDFTPQAVLAAASPTGAVILQSQLMNPQKLHGSCYIVVRAAVRYGLLSVGLECGDQHCSRGPLTACGGSSGSRSSPSWILSGPGTHNKYSCELELRNA